MHFFLTEKPSIITQPKSVTAAIGEPIEFRVSGKGVPALQYQWYKNKFKVSGGTSNILLLEEAILDDTAEYYCIVSNEAGSVQTKTVSVRVFDKNKVVKMTLNVNNPNPERTCHYFFQDKLEQAAGKVLNKNVIVTKIGSNNGNLCNITACSKNPCLNDGECNLLDNSEYKCVCKPGWSGQHCENDLNECINSISPCHGNGQCKNTNGSYICDCPSHLTGRRCEYKKDICEPKPCSSNEVCVPKEHGNFTCVNNSRELTLMIDSKTFTPLNEETTYALQDWLNQIIKTQQTTIPTRRKRRNTDIKRNLALCTIHILNASVTQEKLKVNIILDCPSGDTASADKKAFTTSVCNVFFESGTTVTNSFEQCGNPGDMKQMQQMKPARLDINIVVENQDGSVLGVDEALELLEQKNALKNMGEEYDGFIVEKAYPIKGNTASSNNNSMPIIVGVVCAVVVAAILIAAAVYFKRRNNGYQRQSSIMQKRTKHTLDLVGHSNNAYTEHGNDIKNDGTFMFEMPSALKPSNNEND